MDEAASPRRLWRGWLRRALLVIPAMLLLGLLSARLGDSGPGNFWLFRLAKPALMPPGWVFPAVSSILYMMTGGAFAFILDARGAKGRAVAALFFLVQLALSLAWPPVFFAMHRTMLGLGLILAALLWAGVATLIFWHIRRIAALLMLPWLGWLLFVGLVDWQVHGLNKLASSTANPQIVIH